MKHLITDCRDINADIQDEFDPDSDEEDNDEFTNKLELIDEQQPIDNRNYDEILLEAFENVSNHKSSKIRIDALAKMCNQLQRYHIPKFLNKHIPTITKIIESGFERNIGPEVKWIARLVALYYVQLPREIKFLNRCRAMVIAALENLKSSIAVRSDLFNSIGVLIFLNQNSSKMIFNTMLRFEEIFTEKTFVRINSNEVKNTLIGDVGFLIAILEAWTFLYTLLDCDTKSSGNT